MLEESSASKVNSVVTGRRIGAERRRKEYFLGTHRACSPSETWEKIYPQLAKFGVTRVADITGLDRIGIPVAIAVRPLSRSVSVSAGKGVDLVAAKVSASMEAIECAHAETIARPLFFGSRNEMAQTGNPLDLEDLPALSSTPVTGQTRMLWIEGKNLYDGGSTMVPYELVHAHFAPPSLPGSASFLASTNGLASGNSTVEATCHGLYEVIERDALSRWSGLPAKERNDRLISVREHRDPIISRIVNRLLATDFRLAVWDITSDTQVPTYHCIIVDEQDPEGHPGTGTGCHLDGNVAMARALLEAIQVRAIYISGGRDDLFRSEYEVAHMNSFRSLLEQDGHSPVAPGRPHACQETEYLEDDLAITIERLKKVRNGPVVVVDLSQPDTHMAVVRVIACGFRGPPHSDVSSMRPNNE